MKILICAPLQDAEIKKIQEHFKNDIFIINRKPTQENIDQVDVIIGNPKLNLNLNQEHLQAILLNSAGSDQYIKTGILNENTKLTNASGSYGNAISEQVIGMMITLCKNLKTYALQICMNIRGKATVAEKKFIIVVFALWDMVISVMKLLEG